jgi:tetratricopeptide (TPR) repeat protein
MGRKPVSVKAGETGSRPEKSATASRATVEIKPRRSRNRGVFPKLVAFVLVATVTGVTYLVFKEYQTNRLARTVREAFAARRIEEAGEPLRQWLANRPASGEAFYYKAWAAMAANQPREAMQAIEQSAKLGFDLGLLDCLSAIGQSRSERFKEAEPILEQAFRAQLEPQDMVAKELARIYLSSYRFEQAAGPIERWRKLAPEDPRPYVWSNEILERSDAEPTIAIQNYRAALERDPDLDKARIGLAQQLSKARRFDEAEQEFLTYMKRKPDDSTALLGLGRNSFQQGDIDGARQYFVRALAANPREPDALKELGLIDLRLGRFQEACQSLDRLTQIDPFDHEVRYTFAQALRLTGDEGRANVELAHAARLRKENTEVVEFRNALLKEPNNLNARFQVTKWMFEHGHQDEGLKWTKEILRADPRHSPTHKLLAEFYSKQGDAGLANYHRLMSSADQEIGR